MPEPEERTTGDTGEVAMSRTAFFQAAVNQLLDDNAEFVVVRADPFIKAEALHVVDREDRQSIAYKVAALHSAAKVYGIWLPRRVDQLEGDLFGGYMFRFMYRDEYGYRSYRLTTKRPRSIDWHEDLGGTGTSGRIYDIDPNNPATDNQLSRLSYENLQEDVNHLSGSTPVLPEEMSTRVPQNLLEILI